MGVGYATWLLAALLAGGAQAALVQAQPAGPPPIRVVLSERGPSLQISGALLWSDGQRELGGSSGSLSVALSGDAVRVTLGGKTASAARLVAQSPDPQGCFTFTGKRYRGRAEFFRGKAGGLVLLNVLPVEDYLPGVVPSEMPSNWPIEALRAQAVAARTFALSRMAAHQGDTYDVYPDQSAQVYRGMDGERARATQAVRDTAGQILTYQGAPITAYFFSDAGGYTRTGSLPYLKGVPSLCPDSPFNAWQVPLSPADLEDVAKRAGYSIGQVKCAAGDNDPQTGYLLKLRLEGARGNCAISAGRLRELLGLEKMRSTRVRLAAPEGAASAATASPTGTSTPAVVPQPDAADGGTGAEWSLALLEGWMRPFVASDGGVAALKLRTLYAFDGENLLRCDQPVQAWSSAVANASSGSTGRISLGRYRTQPAAALPTGRMKSTEVDTAGLAAATSAIPVGPAGIVLLGSGYGHGLGLPQYGAKQLAGEGWRYRDILLYFYTGVQLVNWDGTLAAPAAPAPGEAGTEDDAGGFYKPFHWRK
jgi:stage II sporulation protein D